MSDRDFRFGTACIDCQHRIYNEKVKMIPLTPGPSNYDILIDSVNPKLYSFDLESFNDGKFKKNIDSKKHRMFAQGDVITKFSFASESDNSYVIENYIYSTYYSYLLLGITPNLVMPIENGKYKINDPVNLPIELREIKQRLNNSSHLHYISLENMKSPLMYEWLNVHKFDIDLDNILSRLIFQLLYTLEAFNRVGISHRDIHQGNYFIVEKNYDIFYEVGKYLFHIDKGPFVKIFDMDRAFIDCKNSDSMTYEIGELLPQKKMFCHNCNYNAQSCKKYGYCNVFNEWADGFMVLMDIYIDERIHNRIPKTIDFIENIIDTSYLQDVYRKKCEFNGNSKQFRLSFCFMTPEKSLLIKKSIESVLQKSDYFLPFRSLSYLKYPLKNVYKLPEMYSTKGHIDQLFDIMSMEKGKSKITFKHHETRADKLYIVNDNTQFDRIENILIKKIEYVIKRLEKLISTNLRNRRYGYIEIIKYLTSIKNKLVSEIPFNTYQIEIGNISNLPKTSLPIIITEWGIANLMFKELIR